MKNCVTCPPVEVLEMYVFLGHITTMKNLVSICKENRLQWILCIEPGESSTHSVLRNGPSRHSLSLFLPLTQQGHLEASSNLPIFKHNIYFF